VRVFVMSETKLNLVWVSKVFDEPIFKILFSTDFKVMVVTTQKEIFFFQVTEFNMYSA